MRSSGKNLVDAPVGRTLLEMAAPMVIGMAAVILFNVVDTIYVGRMGGSTGVFAGISAGNAAVGGLAMIMASRLLRALSARLH